jgi:4-amino-4-deoxy-L-arabinose transferase-like glycosyltransferase
MLIHPVLIDDLIFIGFSLLVLVVLFLLHMIMFQSGSWRNYEKEMQDFLKDKGLKLVHHRRASDKDWKSSPYAKPPNFKVGQISSRIFGIQFGIEKEWYYVIETNTGVVYWMMIITLFGFKSSIGFRKVRR